MHPVPEPKPAPARQVIAAVVVGQRMTVDDDDSPAARMERDDREAEDLLAHARREHGEGLEVLDASAEPRARSFTGRQGVGRPGVLEGLAPPALQRPEGAGRRQGVRGRSGIRAQIDAANPVAEFGRDAGRDRALAGSIRSDQGDHPPAAHALSRRELGRQCTGVRAMSMRRTGHVAARLEKATPRRRPPANPQWGRFERASVSSGLRCRSSNCTEPSTPSASRQPGGPAVRASKTQGPAHSTLRARAEGGRRPGSASCGER